MESRFRVVEHTADIGLEVYAADKAGIFQEAARGMFSLMIDLERVRVEQNIPVSVQANDHSGLLVSWLNELLYYFSAKHYLFSDFQIKEVTSSQLKAMVGGELIKPEHLPLQHEVKAATYHGLVWQESSSGIWVRLIFDL